MMTADGRVVRVSGVKGVVACTWIGPAEPKGDDQGLGELGDIRHGLSGPAKLKGQAQVIHGQWPVSYDPFGAPA